MQTATIAMGAIVSPFRDTTSIDPHLTTMRFPKRMIGMDTVEKPLIPAKLLAELQAAVDNAVKGIRDPEVAKKACRDMDRMREELRKKVGILDVSVDLVRETRDEL